MNYLPRVFALTTEPPSIIIIWLMEHPISSWMPSFPSADQPDPQKNKAAVHGPLQQNHRYHDEGSKINGWLLRCDCKMQTATASCHAPKCRLFGLFYANCFERLFMGNHIWSSSLLLSHAWLPMGCATPELQRSVSSWLLPLRVGRETQGKVI